MYSMIRSRKKKRGEKITKDHTYGTPLVKIETHEPLLTGSLLIGSLVVLAFHPAAYTIIPYLTVRLIRRTGEKLKGNTLPFLLTSFLLIIFLSPLLREITFLTLSLVTIWFGYALWIVWANQNELAHESKYESKHESTHESKHESKHETKHESTHDPLQNSVPLFTTLFLTLFLILLDIPNNRYLSMATGYRMEVLHAMMIIIPVFSALIGVGMYRLEKRLKIPGSSVSHAVLVFILCSLVLMVGPFFTDSQMVVTLALVFIGSTIVMGTMILNQRSWAWSPGLGKTFAKFDGMFPELLVSQLIFGLVIVTLPPVAFTVFVMPVPIPIAYILYSLPMVLIFIGLVLLGFSKSLTHTEKL